MARPAHVALTILLAAAAARADPADDAAAARCRPDGRLLPAARAALAEASPDPDAQRARTEAAGMFAPTVYTTVLPANDPAALDAAIARARHTTLQPRCAVATDGARLALALAPRVVEVLTETAHGATTVRAALPQGATRPQLAVTDRDGAVTVFDFDDESSVLLPAALVPATMQVVATLGEGPVPLATWHPAPVARARRDTLVDVRDLLGAINRERAAAGARALRRDPLLDGVAMGHARTLAALGAVSHRPTPDDGPIERLERAQVAAERVAENVARAGSLTDAHARWMGSPSHRANVLDPALDAVGFGVARREGELYVVELFATHPTLSAGP
jgi:uncharacterized protein YkwD